MTEQTMIERMAKALALYRRGSEVADESDRNAARAVLAAMREPTEEMVEAGDSAIPNEIESSIQSLAAAKECWQQMINTAIDEAAKE